MRYALEERLKVPGVAIPCDIVHLRVFSPDEAMSEIEAFLETMDYHRDIRKQAGMEW